MTSNNYQIIDYDAVLNETFGKHDTPSRNEAEEKAYAFYTANGKERIASFGVEFQ